MNFSSSIMSGIGISLGGLEIATDFLFANTDFYEPDLTEVKSTISHKNPSEIKPSIKAVRPKVTKESIINKFSLIPESASFDSDEVIDSTETTIYEDNDFDFSFDSIDKDTDKNGNSSTTTKEATKTEAELEEDEALLQSSLILSRLSGEGQDMEMEELQLDDELTLDDIDELEEDSEFDIEEDGDTEELDIEDLEFDEDSKTDEIDIDNLDFGDEDTEESNNDELDIETDETENEDDIEIKDDIEIEDEDSGELEIDNNEIEIEDDEEEGFTLEDLDAEQETTQTTVATSQIENKQTLSKEQPAQKASEVVVEQPKNNVQASSISEVKSEPIIKEEQDSSETHKNIDNDETQDRISRLEQELRLLKEQQSAKNTSDLSDNKNININVKVKHEGDTEKEVEVVEVPVRRTSNPYERYAELPVEKLYAIVKNYMLKSGVKTQVVSLAKLNEKFGEANIKKLIQKGYLIKFKKGVTAGK